MKIGGMSEREKKGFEYKNFYCLFKSNMYIDVKLSLEMHLHMLLINQNRFEIIPNEL